MLSKPTLAPSDPGLPSRHPPAAPAPNSQRVYPPRAKGAPTKGSTLAPRSLIRSALANLHEPMNIADQTVVSLQYVLKNATGEILDQCDREEPLCYLHGSGNLIPGVEEALVGSTTGATMQVVITPEKGYGERDDQLVLEVPRSELPEGDLQVGMQFQVEHEGGRGIVTVANIEEDKVTLDGNHPLAGETLHFDLEVLDVRAATSKEVEQGSC